MDPFEQAALGLLQQLLGQQQSEALQSTVNSILQAVNAALVLLRQIVADLVNPTTGLAAIQAELATFQATTATDFTAVLTAIAATQQTGVPVTLPTHTPAGGTWLDAGNVNSVVWNQPDVFTGTTALSDLSNVAIFVGNQENRVALPGTDSQPFHWNADLLQTVPYPLVLSNSPVFPLTSILSTDTLLTFLDTANPGWTWVWEDPSHSWARASDPLSFSAQWYCDVSAIGFAALKAALFPTTVTAPVWPGIAGVTLGAVVALANGLVVAGPLSGVLVVVSSVPTPISYYPFGAIKSFVRAGAVIFTSDNGDSEFPQPLGPDDEVVLPKLMSSAASATFRVASGIVGTVQGFTIP